MVHGRDIEGKVDRFGVSGYVHKNVFVLFDRKTESLWYPLKEGQWSAISGPRKGETIPFLGEPPVISLGEWRKKHPGTVVLFGQKKTVDKTDDGK